jgi:release factor glutamine methyltransferase
VALALKQERPDLVVAGSDLSPQALELARENARRLGLKVRWLHSDLLGEIPDDFDAILANPPYVAEADRLTLAPEIMRHEPHRALFAGPDGLDVIRRLIEQAAERAPLRMVALEVGAGQAGEVAELLRGAGFAEVAAELDLAGIERVVRGERPPR